MATVWKSDCLRSTSLSWHIPPLRRGLSVTPSLQVPLPLPCALSPPPALSALSATRSALLCRHSGSSSSNGHCPLLAVPTAAALTTTGGTAAITAVDNFEPLFLAFSPRSSVTPSIKSVLPPSSSGTDCTLCAPRVLLSRPNLSSHLDPASFTIAWVLHLFRCRP